MNEDLKKSDMHKKMTYFAKKWPNTVKKIGQRKDELKVRLNDIIQYHLEYRLYMGFWWGTKDS